MAELFWWSLVYEEATMGEISRGGHPDPNPDLSKSRGGHPDPDLSKSRDGHPEL